MLKMGDYTIFEYIKEWLRMSKTDKAIVREMKKIMAERNDR